ncbi:MAG: hypothetical protein ACJ789_00795 [Thermomicrobiales bacterium]
MSSPLVLFISFIMVLIILDLLALRFGASSQSPRSDQKNWW